MKPENQVKISCSEIPSVDLRNFCRTFGKAIERSAEDPSFMKKYEQYRASKEAEKLQNEEASVCDTVTAYVGCNVVRDSVGSKQ